MEEIQPSGRSPLGDGLVPDFMEEIDNDVVLYDAQAVEVFPHRACQLVFALSSEFFAPRDRRRVEPDAASLSEDPLMIVARECGRGVEAVRATVCVEDFSFEGWPLELESSANNCQQRKCQLTIQCLL